MYCCIITSTIFDIFVCLLHYLHYSVHTEVGSLNLLFILKYSLHVNLFEHVLLEF